VRECVPDSYSNRQLGVGMRQACTARSGHARSTGKPVYGRRVPGSRIPSCAPFRPPFGRRNVSVFAGLDGWKAGLFGKLLFGLLLSLASKYQ
jgi:hypothetical protein